MVILSLSVNVGSEPYGFRPRQGGFEMEDYITYRHRLEHQKPERDWQQIEWFTYRHVRIDTVLMCGVSTTRRK